MLHFELEFRVFCFFEDEGIYGEKPPLGTREIASNILYSHVASTPGLEPRPELVKSEFFN